MRERVFEEENCGQLIDLLARIFVWSPSTRITRIECTQHLFFESVRSVDLRIVSEKNANPLKKTRLSRSFPDSDLL
jgi:hypothetical protein